MKDELKTTILSLEKDLGYTKKRPEGSFSVAEFAEVWRVSESHARRLVRELAKKGVLEEVGKFKLAKEAVDPSERLVGVRMYRKVDVAVDKKSKRPS